MKNSFEWRSGKYYIKLQKVIDEWGDYSAAAFGVENDEEKAKKALMCFFEVLRKCPKDGKLNLGLRKGYYSFLINMLPLEFALANDKYALACHELETLFVSEPILQKRIYCNLWRLYQKYICPPQNT